jgi:ferredoxin-type protein NapH
MLGMIYLSLYAHYRAAHALEDETQTPGARATILNKIDARVSAMDDPQKFLDDNKGTIWSMRLRLFDPEPDGLLGRLCTSIASLTGGLDLSRPDLTDPLAAAEALAAGKRWYWPLLLSIFFPVLFTLLLGKVFCSWICPAGLLFEITGKLRKLLRFAELPPAEVKFSRANKYVLLGIGLAVAGVVGLPIFTLIYPPAAISRLLHAWVFGTSLAGVLVVLGVIVAFELVVSPRWWCRTMCPGGALYGLIGWPRLLRIKLDADRCTRCRKCEPVCEPGLNPVVESAGIECDNCGECVGACPEQALYYSISLPRKKADGKSRPRSGAAQRVKIGAALVLAAVSLGSPAAARAHHILGLPHYSYKENYPQAPVLEYPATTGPYSVLMQCYPGTPIPGQPANLVFDIKNTETGERYHEPIRVRVVQTFTFGANEGVLAATEVPAYEVLHKLAATFPNDGEYVVEMTMDVKGRPETIGFLMIAGDPGAATSVVILASCMAGLALFLVTVRAVKKKRNRRRQLAIA